MTELPEIKPCPFCGGSGFVDAWTDDCFCSCSSMACSMVGPSGVMTDADVAKCGGDFELAGKLAAIRAWNHRAEVSEGK